jgi:hypothetical protein
VVPIGYEARKAFDLEELEKRSLLSLLEIEL